MTGEFAAGKVAGDVIAELERQRETLAKDPAATRQAVETALAPVRTAYAESQLPPAYFTALETELVETLPKAWLNIAQPFTALEARSFGRWRGGDLTAKLTYVLGGLVLGGLILKAPFIPIWEKWVPFAMAVAGWWLPDAQAAWHRRRYGRELGRIIQRLEARQPALEARVPMSELLPPGGGS
jgi:hypothetical protein